jgi:hypothetical protein
VNERRSQGCGERCPDTSSIVQPSRSTFFHIAMRGVIRYLSAPSGLGGYVDVTARYRMGSIHTSSLRQEPADFGDFPISRYELVQATCRGDQGAIEWSQSFEDGRVNPPAAGYCGTGKSMTSRRGVHHRNSGEQNLSPYRLLGLFRRSQTTAAGELGPCHRTARARSVMRETFAFNLSEATLYASSVFHGC